MQENTTTVDVSHKHKSVLQFEHLVRGRGGGGEVVAIREFSVGGRRQAAVLDVCMCVNVCIHTLLLVHQHAQECEQWLMLTLVLVSG